MQNNVLTHKEVIQLFERVCTLRNVQLGHTWLQRQLRKELNSIEIMDTIDPDFANTFEK